MRKSLVLFGFFINIAAFAFSQRVVTLHLSDQPVSQILKAITVETGVDFFYSDQVFDASRIASIDVTDAPLEQVLNELLGNDYNIRYEEDNQLVIITGKKTIKPDSGQYERSSDQEHRLSGVVTGAQDEPLVGVTIWVKHTRMGTITDTQGRYSLSASPGDTLQFKSVGYVIKDVVVGTEKELNVTLEEDLVNLGAVTVVSTGYQQIDKARATGSYVVMDAEELKKIPVNNVIQRLEGQVAGLQVNITDADNSFVYGTLIGDAEGQSSYNFTIRGTSTYSQSGGTSSPLVVLDGTPTQIDIKTLNPNDIEKITFLKDAAAASIYGVRAANGVIVIDTKKGSAEKMTIAYSQNYTIGSNPSVSKLPLMNSAQVLDLEQELVDRGSVIDPTSYGMSYLAPSISQGMTAMLAEQRGDITQEDLDAELSVLKGRNNYYQVDKYLLQAQSAQNYNLSLSGGQKNYNYFFSGSYSREKTQTVGNDGQRMTLLANQGFKLFNYATLNTSLKGSVFHYNQNGIGLTALSASSSAFLPYNQIVDENGNSVGYYRRYSATQSETLEAEGYLPWTYNYLQELHNSNKTIKEQDFYANSSLTIPLILKGLNAQGTYSIERGYTQNVNIYNSETYFARDLVNYATSVSSSGALVYGIPKGGIYQSNDYIKTNYTARMQLNYNNEVAKDHYVSAMAGAEFRQLREEVASRTLYGYNEDTQISVDLPANNYTAVNGYYTSVSYNNTQTNQRRRFLSYYGNASYTYKNKYTLSGSARLDDYNNFGVDKKYRRLPLWSTGMKWDIKKESFLQNVHLINALTLRMSYGFNGNVNLTTFPFTYISLASSYDSFSQESYASIISAANPALKWEKTGIFNVGLDYSLLDSRLTGTVEFYHKDITDLIYTYAVSAFYGVPSDQLTRNMGTMEAHGVDLSLTGTLIKKQNFSWDLGGVVTYNKSNVTDGNLDNVSQYLNGSGTTPPIKGYSLNSLFAFRSAGLDENGATLIYDRNGNTVDAYTALSDIKDMKYMGSNIPAYFGSIKTNVQYKKFSLYVLATYKLHYVMFKPTFRNFMSYGYFYQYDLHKDVDKRWREPGDEANTIVPGISALSSGYSNARYRMLDKMVMPGDHIRLKEISLSYDLSGVFLKRIVSGASVSFAARNLGILWRKNKYGIDPDFPPSMASSSIKLPPLATYNFGLNLNF